MFCENIFKMKKRINLHVNRDITSYVRGSQPWLEDLLLTFVF